MCLRQEASYRLVAPCVKEMYRGIPSSVIMLLHAQIFGCTQILKMPNFLNPLILGRDHKRL